MQKINERFGADNFASRRTTGHNMYDPESLITGREVAQGFTYLNSRRDYPDQFTYDAIVEGAVPQSLVPEVAPRIRKDFDKEVVWDSIHPPSKRGI